MLNAPAVTVVGSSGRVTSNVAVDPEIDAEDAITCGATAGPAPSGLAASTSSSVIASTCADRTALSTVGGCSSWSSARVRPPPLLCRWTRSCASTMPASAPGTTGNGVGSSAGRASIASSATRPRTIDLRACAGGSAPAAVITASAAGSGSDGGSRRPNQRRNRGAATRGGRAGPATSVGVPCSRLRESALSRSSGSALEGTGRNRQASAHRMTWAVKIVPPSPSSTSSRSC